MSKLGQYHKHSKTQRALALFDKRPEHSALWCALQVGLTPSALYAAIREREAVADGRCYACGRPFDTPTEKETTA
jgi:hypothetical protein